MTLVIGPLGWLRENAAVIPLIGGPMAERAQEEEMPFAQKVLDSPFLLLFACIILMFGFYTIWGWIELVRLPQAPLP